MVNNVNNNNNNNDNVNINNNNNNNNNNNDDNRDVIESHQLVLKWDSPIWNAQRTNRLVPKEG